MIAYYITLICSFFAGISYAVYLIITGGSFSLSIVKGLCIAIACGFSLTSVIWIIIALLSMTVSAKRVYSKPSAFYCSLFNSCYKYLCLLAGIRVRVTGLEKLKKVNSASNKNNQRFMFVSNHRSKFDNMIESFVLKEEPLAFISKPENFKIPMGRRFMNRCCYLSLDRGNLRHEVETIHRAIQLVDSGAVSIGVYPEGHRSLDGTLDEFKPGCFKIAEKTACPIVVSVIRGTENVHKNFPLRRTVVHFDVLQVLTAEELSGCRTVEISNKVHSIMEKAL